MEIHPSITLTEHEVQIFDKLSEILDKNDKKTVMRVAGGWVRDKLLGKESDDIDIALDDMMGSEMVKMVNAELYPGQEKFGIIKIDAERSKHLETGTIKVFGKFVDFVNLREEEYTIDCAIPQVKMGTPEKDAERRDLTINSLFYNIKEKKIEDFTGKGIEDL